MKPTSMNTCLQHATRARKVVSCTVSLYLNLNLFFQHMHKSFFKIVFGMRYLEPVISDTDYENLRARL